MVHLHPHTPKAQMRDRIFFCDTPNIRDLIFTYLCAPGNTVQGNLHPGMAGTFVDATTINRTPPANPYTWGFFSKPQASSAIQKLYPDTHQQWDSVISSTDSGSIIYWNDHHTPKFGDITTLTVATAKENYRSGKTPKGFWNKVENILKLKEDMKAAASGAPPKVMLGKDDPDCDGCIRQISIITPFSFS